MYTVSTLVVVVLQLLLSKGSLSWYVEATYLHEAVILIFTQEMQGNSIPVLINYEYFI